MPRGVGDGQRCSQAAASPYVIKQAGQVVPRLQVKQQIVALTEHNLGFRQHCDIILQT